MAARNSVNTKKEKQNPNHLSACAATFPYIVPVPKSFFKSFMEMLGLPSQEGGGLVKKLYDLVGRVGRFTAFSKS
jgi:hypothetical protein